MTMKLKVTAPSKLNLYLDIDSKRPDGYHNLNMIMQTINLCDEIYIEITEDKKIDITVSDKNIPTGKNNIVYKAVEIFYKNCIQKFTGVKININKCIPSEAGMGGGSADAAAVLIGLNFIENNLYKEKEILEMGKILGADVPFAIKGGTCIVRGIGDIITPVNPLKNLYFVIIKPDVGISTAAAYKAVDNNKFIIQNKFDEMITAVKSESLNEMKKYMQNIFELVSDVPEVELCKQHLLQEGAEFAMMTGSGSAVFGIFTDIYQAKKAKENLEKIFKKVYLAEPINKGSYIDL